MTHKHIMISLLFLLLYRPVTATAQKQTLMIGLLPDENAKVLLQRFEPVRRRMEKTLGRKVKVAIPSLQKNYNYDDLIEHFVAGKIQLAYFGGFSFLKASGRTASIAVAMRKKDTKFRSYFITRTTKNISSLEALKGMRFTFGSPSSTSGHLMPRYFLKENGIDPETDFNGQALFSGTHDNTIEWVIQGKADAGVLNATVFNRHLREGKIDPQQIAVISVTPGYPDYIWALRADSDKLLKEKIPAFFLQLIPGIAEDEILLKALSANYYVAPEPSKFDRLKKIATELKLLGAK